jgi:hypothetical protein
MDGHLACSLRFGRDAQPVEMPPVRLRAVSPGYRPAQDRRPVRDVVLRLQPMQRDVPQPRPVRREQHGEPERRSAARRGYADAAEAVSRPLTQLDRIASGDLARRPVPAARRRPANPRSSPGPQAVRARIDTQQPTLKLRDWVPRGRRRASDRLPTTTSRELRAWVYRASISHDR